MSSTVFEELLLSEFNQILEILQLTSNSLRYHELKVYVYFNNRKRYRYQISNSQCHFRDLFWAESCFSK